MEIAFYTYNRAPSSFLFEQYKTILYRVYQAPQCSWKRRENDSEPSYDFDITRSNISKYRAIIVQLRCLSEICYPNIRTIKNRIQLIAVKGIWISREYEYYVRDI